MKSRKNFRLLFPKLQGRFLLLMLLCSGASVILSGCLTVLAFSNVAGALPHDGDLVLRELPGVMGIQLLVGLALAVPVFGLIGAFASMPLFGTLFRFHGYMKDVENGVETEELTLRDGDPMVELSRMISRATEPRRAENAKNAEEEPDVSEAA